MRFTKSFNEQIKFTAAVQRLLVLPRLIQANQQKELGTNSILLLLLDCILEICIYLHSRVGTPCYKVLNNYRYYDNKERYQYLRTVKFEFQ